MAVFMTTVLLIIQLLVALGLIGVILLQRSEAVPWVSVAAVAAGA